MIELVRWDVVERPAKSLKLQKCTWGGFTRSLISLVEMNSSFVNIWHKDCTEHHNKPLVASIYLLDMNRAYLLQVAKMAYSYGESEIKLGRKIMEQMGIFITLDEGDKFAELRIVKSEVLEKLSDA
jgi:hypothetical protein